MIFTRAHAYLASMIFLLLSFTYYWNEVRHVVPLKQEGSDKKTIFFYLHPLDHWKKLSTSSWTLKQKKKNQWWIEEFDREQTPQESKRWQKDLAQVIIEAEMTEEAARKEADQSCARDLSRDLTIEIDAHEKTILTFCPPHPITGKFLVRISNELKTFSRKKVTWFWAFTDRPFDGLYRDESDRYSQSFHRWMEEWNDLAYVVEERKFLQFAGISSLERLKVSYPKTIIYEVDFLNSQFSPLPKPPLTLDTQKIVQFKSYLESLKPIKVEKGKMFRDVGMITVVINQTIKADFFWPIQKTNAHEDLVYVYLPHKDLTFTFPGKELASKLLFVQNFTSKKISSLAQILEKETSKKQLNETLWKEMACYATACNSSHEFLRFYSSRPPQLEEVAFQELVVDEKPLKVYPADGVWWLEVGPEEFYLFPGRISL